MQPIHIEQHPHIRAPHSYRMKETRNSHQPLATSHVLSNRGPQIMEAGGLMSGRVPSHNHSQFVNRKNTLNIVNVRHGQQVAFSAEDEQQL